MPISGDDFRAALSCWASGVSIVTTRAGERVHGMTVSAFSSVSLDPPLVLVCADKSSDTLAVIEAGGVFAVNVLGSGQEELSNRFASKKDEHLRFAGLDWKPAPVTGAPLLPDAMATLDCRVVAGHEAGDHVIYVGQVEAVQAETPLEGAGSGPLVYWGGRYQRLAGQG